MNPSHVIICKHKDATNWEFFGFIFEGEDPIVTHEFLHKVPSKTWTFKIFKLDIPVI